MCRSFGDLAHMEGGMDRQDDLASVGKVASSAEDFVSPINAHREDRCIQLGGDDEGTLFEALHLAGEGATSFREDEDRVARSQYLLGVSDGMDDRRGALLIDEDEMSGFASLPYEGDVSELLLHHPFEGNADVPIEDEDVKGALMIGHHDTGGI